MTGKSTYLANALLNKLFGGVGYSFPATLYLSLHTAAFSPGGAQAELAGNNYARVAVTVNQTDFPAASGGIVANGAQFNFPVISGTTAQILSWGIFDAPTGGNMLYGGDLASVDQKVYSQNDQPVIPVGSLSITES